MFFTTKSPFNTVNGRIGPEQLGNSLVEASLNFANAILGDLKKEQSGTSHKGLLSDLIEQPQVATLLLISFETAKIFCHIQKRICNDKAILDRVWQGLARGLHLVQVDGQQLLPKGYELLNTMTQRYHQILQVEWGRKLDPAVVRIYPSEAIQKLCEDIKAFYFRNDPSLKNNEYLNLDEMMFVAAISATYFVSADYFTSELKLTYNSQSP